MIKRSLILSAALLLSGSLVVAFLGLAGAGRAASRPGVTIQVTSFSDDLNLNGNCTLREAIRAANTDAGVDACPAGAGADTIVLAPGVYTLTLAGRGEDAGATGDLDLTSSLTLQGAGPATVLHGMGTDRLLHLHPPAEVTLIDLSITGGDPGPGVGPGLSGGGISLSAGSRLHLDGVLLTGNHAYNGGALYNNGGTVDLIDSTVYSNTAAYAGGIYNGGSLVVRRSSLTRNHAQNYAGGLHSSGTLLCGFTIRPNCPPPSAPWRAIPPVRAAEFTTSTSRPWPRMPALQSPSRGRTAISACRERCSPAFWAGTAPVAARPGRSPPSAITSTAGPAASLPGRTT